MDYTPEQQELIDEFKLKDLRNLKTDHYIQKLNEFKNKDTECQLKMLEAMPDNLKFLAGSIGVCQNAIQLVLDSDSTDGKQVFENYQQILNDIRPRLQDDNLTNKQRLEYINLEIEVADKCADFAKENNAHRQKLFEILLGTVGTVALGALGYIGKTKFFPKKN